MAEIISNYEKLEILGRGVSAKVYKCKHITKGTMASMKVFSHDDDNEEDMTKYYVAVEVEILNKVKHPNVIKVIKTKLTSTRIYIFYTYSEYTLYELIYDDHSYIVLPIIEQIYMGLAHCHSQGVIHTDIKPDNIFINSQGRVKIGDFGEAIYNDDDINDRPHTVTSLWYRAPELIMGMKDYDYAIDIWSVGCIYYQLVCKNVLFRGSDEIDQLFTIFRILGTVDSIMWPGVVKLPYYNCTYPKWEENTHAFMIDGLDPILLLSLFNYDPQIRMTAKEAVNYINN